VVPPSKEASPRIETPLKEILPKKEKPGLFDQLKEYGKWLWQLIKEFFSLFLPLYLLPSK